VPRRIDLDRTGPEPNDELHPDGQASKQALLRKPLQLRRDCLPHIAHNPY
jgi:hypothetical protein